MSPAPQVKLFIYENFAKDWNTLPPTAKGSIKKFLLNLQTNPYDPGLQLACELDHTGERFAYTTPEGYAVFWSAAESNPVSVTRLDQVAVRVLGIHRI